MESLLVITNTEAGSVDEHNVRAAVDVLRTGADVQVSRTSMPGDLDGILHRRGGRKVVVAGGDGSLHTVVAALHRRMELDQTVLGLLPLGTANDFARAVGLPLDPAEAARVILSGVERRHDLLVDCRGNVVVHRVRVAAREQSSMARRLRGTGPLRVRVEAEHAGRSLVLADFDQPVSWIQVSNGHLRSGRAEGSGRGTATAEDTSAVSSAEVRMAFTRPRLPAVPSAVSRKLRLPGSAVTTARVDRLQVAGQRFYLNADGELEGPERNQTWTVVPGRLRLISPTG